MTLWLGSFAASFTRPADTTAYASGDLVANSTTAGSVAPLSWTPNNANAGFYVSGVRLRLDKSDLTGASFRAHLYSATPTFVTAGDNSAFSTVVATGYASALGSYEGTLHYQDAAGVFGILAPYEAIIQPVALVAGSTIYGLLEARGVYTPKSAGVVTAELIVEGPS